MTPPLSDALDVSRRTLPDAAGLSRILPAEESIALADDASWEVLRRQLSAQPADGFLWLWNGLVLERRSHPQAACNHYAEAIERGCAHWRVGWYIARAARSLGNLELVDSACAAVLKANPEFWFARELPKHARGYYAQLGQDKIIEDFFKDHPPRSRRFVEVGAFDGVHYSNVRRLHEVHGWTGLCIEPVSKNFAKLAASYRGSDVRCVRAAASDRDGDLEIHVSHYPHLPDWGSDVASLGGEDQERWTKRYGAQWTIENVPARRLSRLLAEAGIDDFDVLSIDAEGHDFEVLSGLDFARYQPQLVVVEFGSRKDDIRRLLERHGYAIAQDNRQDFVAVKPASVAPRIAPAPAPTNADADAAAPDALGPVSPDRLPSLLERLNPHLLALRTLPLDRPIVRADLAPADLLSAARFDLPAKLLYARHRALGVHAEHAARVYEEHVRAFSKGSCREGDGIKSGLEDYVRAFDAVLDSVRERGLDPRVSLMPVDRHHVPIDGAHRAAAAIAFDSRVPALVFDFQANRYDWRFFRDRGLPESTLDALALEFVRHRTDTHFLHLFPTAEGRDAEVRALLQEHGTIVYEKSLRLTGEGPATLVRELYAREAWIGTWANGFAGARKDASVRFGGTDALRLFLFCCDDLDRAKALKARVRELFGQGNYSCHVNDSHEETLRLARTYFNANSVHFLNHARPRYLQRFHRHLEIYREWLRASGADPEGFCVDGSASLAAYGLRDAQDLDVLHLGAADFAPLRPGVNSHNDHVAHHAVGRDRILFDPEHHFYYAGLKFVALPTLRAMKSRRAEGKDLADVALIDELAAQPATPARPVVDVLAKDAPREALRVYYVPNGDDYHIAALLERLYTTVQPFGCRDVRDYIERRVLAYKTPNAGIRMWDEVQAMRPDIVYVESARNIDPSVLQRIRTELGIPVTMWFGDACVNDEFVQRILSYASSVTHQVTVDRHVARAARQKGLGNVEFVPFFGYDHYFRPLEEPKSIDILFSGKSYCRSFKRYPFAAERLAFVQRVDREFGARLLVVGEDWESLGLSNLQPKRVPEWDVNRLNNQSRIVLAYDAAHVDGFTSCRTYHALLGRTFVLLRKFPGAERLFINREHLVWFETEQEGIDLLRHYLAHPEECDRIARSGYQHVRANGWMFSNVVRHLVHRGLGRYSRSFEEVFAPFSKSLPQTGDASASSRASTGSATSPSPAPASPPKAKAKAGPKRTANAVDDCLRQADRFFRENNLAQARSWLERALDLEPSAADIWVASGNLAIQLGDVEQGIQELRRASELRPDHAPTLAALAAAYVRGGHVEEFEKALASALAADPDEPSAVRLLADLNFQCGHFKDAANGFYRLARKNPSDIDALLPLGVCFAKTGDAEAARCVFEEILRQKPDHAIARENLVAVGGTVPPAAPAAASKSPATGDASSRSPVRPTASSSSAKPVETAAELPPPLVSAIVSTYKSERYLRGCLQDLLDQTIADRLEIIVVDSGSPENERAIVEEFQKKHPRIVYLRTERETIYAAWNRGAKLASAPYLTSANADDRHRPEALARLVALLESRPDCSVAYADCAVCENVHPDFGYTEIRGYYRWPEFDPALLFRGCYVGPQPVWRRSLHDRYGGFDPAYRSAGDYEFWLRLAKSETFVHLPEILGLHWYAESSLGHQNRDLTRDESDRARRQHWPAEWGQRPTEPFKTLHLTPALEKQRKRVADLSARVQTLERDNAALQAALETRPQPLDPAASPSPSIAPSTPVAAAPASPPPGDARRDAIVPTAVAQRAAQDATAPTVPALSLLPSDSNPEAFQHLLRGFDLVREGRFEEANAEAAQYREKVVYDSLHRTDRRAAKAPTLSVVVVAYQTRQALLACLDSLEHPDNPPFEVIVVDNGGNESIEAELHRRPVLHVRPPVNVLPSEARNIGVHFARGTTVVFVDDDATVEPGYLATIARAFEAYEIVGFRGKVVPVTQGEDVRLRVRHYDLGDQPLTADLNTEGNCAVRVADWKQVGGQDCLLFGGEGVEFSFRVVAHFGPAALIYWPSSVIRHDYADEDSKLERKTDRHRAARAYLEWKHPGIREYHDHLKLRPSTDDERLQRTSPLRPRQAGQPIALRPPEAALPAPRRSQVVDTPIAVLRSALSHRGWMAKFDAYAAKLKRLEFFPAVPEPRLSVVIIAHEIRVDSVRVLRRLQEDRDGRFEIVYVLNGSRAVEAEQVRPYVDTVVELTENTGAYFARNVGAVFAKAPVLFFLDDDAIPERGCVAAHIDEFERFDVIAVRGAILPKTNNPLNELAKHYHLGDRRFPIHADVEGNTSYLDRTFFAVGGWDDEIVFGGGGIDLAFRLLQVDPDRRHQIYSPVPVVYHDYAANEEHLAKKHKKQTESRERLHRKHPNYDTLKHAWRSFRDKEHLVMPKVPGSRPPTNGSDAPTARPTASTTSADAGPFVTIAIPTYNRARFLEEAVRSALDQTYPRLEVLVVDDGSTDDTALLARGFGDSRVRYVAKEHTGGPDTRNRCIAEARGEFVLWLDSDDVLLADTLALYVAELRRSPGIDVLYGNLLVADEQLRVQEVWSYDDYHGWSEALLSESVIENRIPNGGTLVRRSCYERFGPYNTSFARSHDYEFWSRLAAEGEVKSIGTEVAIYRRHEESLTRLRRPADTRHEANTVKGLVSRHPLSLLFPFCYPAGRASAAGDARAWSIASLLMAKYGDNKTAVLYARRSVEAADIGRNVELLRILEVLDGANPAPQRNAARQDDEIGGLIDTAKRQYAADRVHACAKACARLSEIQPEAPETLLLSAMSLRRWGAAADAMTAYQCLIRRLCATAYAAAVSAEIPLETAAPPVSSAARTSIVRRLAERLAPVFGLGSIPEPIVADTVEFALRVADAADPATFLALHLQGQTPLFFGMLGVLEDILAAEPDPVLADALPRVRAGLAGKAPAPTSRKPGYSFCIITGGTRPEKVVRQIASIRALGLEHYEILVGGDVGHVPDDVRKVDLAQTAKAGRLGRMRNALARLATYDHLIVADDDLVFDLNFADGLKRFGEGYEVMAVRILNTDGTRFWDWACTGGLKGSVLLDYWEADPHVYVTGGICVLKTDVLDHVEWDELKGFYEREDVDFSNRLKAAGHTIRYNVFSAVTHDDDRYSRVGRCVYRFDHLLGDILQNQTGRPGAETTEMLLEARRMAGSAPERIAAVADVARRLGVHLPAATPHRPAPTPEPVTPTSRADATAPAPAAPLSTTAPADPTRSSEAATTRVESTTVDWIGTFLDHGSLSHVNREFTEALQSRPGMLVRRVAKAPPLSKGSTPDPTGIASKLVPVPSRHAAVTVRHAWPPQWDRPKSGALVVIQPWEYGSLPRSWVQDLADVDEVWIPSEYVRRLYVDSGVPESKVVVVPNGIDPDRFRPDAPPLELATRKRFKFLFVGGTIHRKGPDVLLEAFLSAFDAEDDVCLVIKDFGGKDVYAGQTIEQSIRAAQARPNAPEILYLDQDLPADSMPGLYTACDCLVHPYRGEGFGLPVLEAMACGLPVVVTAGGATDDFAGDNVAYRIPAVRKEIGSSISGMPLVRPGWLLEPDRAALSERICWIFEHQDQARSLGLTASREVRRHWTWARACDIAVDRIRRLTHLDRDRSATTPARTQPASKPRRPVRIELPDCARIAHLGLARELLDTKRLRESWEATLQALGKRPFHPEAYLHLAEIARAAGDSITARQCAQYARSLAPQWKPAKTFLKAPLRGNSRPAWLLIPPEFAPGNPRTPRISVCLIVKNEERFLGQCLTSIQPVADQIVVVDTGSTDRTVEIAREFGAEIHTFAWRDDFSAARNAALEHANGDWVLMLDADETLPAEQHAKLREDLKKTKVLGFRLPLLNVGAEADGLAYVPRLYRNAPGLFYISRVHEQVFSSILVRAEEWGLDTAFGTAQIKHFGYTKELVRERNKVERNLKLLREAVEELPDDPNLLMNLGLETMHSGDLEGGLVEYEKAFQALCAQPEHQRIPELRQTLLTQYATALMRANRFQEVVRVLESPVAKAYEPTASLHFALGLAYFRTNRPSAAAAEIKECLAKRHLPTVSPINPEIWKAGPYHCLALCLASGGRLGEAEAAFIAALRDESTSRVVRLDLARLYQRMGRTVDALKVLHELIDKRLADPEVWRLGGAIALSSPELVDFAVEWTGEAVKHHPTQPSLAGQHGEALLVSGDAGAAIAFLRTSAIAGDVSHAGALRLAELSCELRPTPVLPDQEAEVASHFLRWFQRLTSTRGNSALHRVLDQADILQRTLPSAARALRAAMTEAA